MDMCPSFFSRQFKIKRALMAALTGAVFCLTAAAPAEAGKFATGLASAEIIQPLYVKTKSALSFGELECSTHEGRVTVSPTDQRKITVDIKMSRGGFYPASFQVSGTPFFYYSVTTPQTLIFDVAGKGFHHDDFDDHHDDHDRHGHHGHHGRDDDNHHHGHQQSELLVKDFTTYSSTLGSGGNKGQLGHHGRDMLYVGGTLIVPGNAAPGLYRGFVP